MALPTIAVCILFYEKTDQTIACVESFLSSGYPIIVLNNGSSDTARERFEKWSKGFSQIRLINSDKNLGISVGRNLLIRETTEDWLLFVDNDIVMNTAEWQVNIIQHTLLQDVEVIIPRLYNQHYGCYAEYFLMTFENQKVIFTSAKSNNINVFPGGASLINRNLFNRLGIYDDQLFVGFEDFELALRGILANKPIRALLISDVELIHDHLFNYHTDDDIQAVISRYDKEVIRRSINRIREKHGITIEDDWEKWVDHQVITIKKVHCHNAGDKKSMNVNLPKIALVADVRDWAFGNIAKCIVDRLSDKYEFKIIYTEDFKGDYEAIFRALYEQPFDLVHFFWRETILNLYMHILRTRGSISDTQIETFISSKISFSIYDHCLLDENVLKDYQIVFKYLSTGYTVSSERLFRIYGRIPAYPSPDMVISDGVDLSKFMPINIERLTDSDRPIVIGWAGNSTWGKDIDGFDYKGLRTILKPAVVSLCHDGVNVAGKYADRNIEFIPHEKMPEYYNSLDIFVCSSLIEGTPNPVLEAMASGLPVVSTDVGVVPQLFGPLQKEFILGVRSVSALKEKLKILAMSPELRKKLSEENLNTIQSWTRDSERPKWDLFFSMMLKCNDPHKQLAKRACLEVPYNYGIETTVGLFLKDSLSWKLTHPLRLIFWNVMHLKQNLKTRFLTSRSNDEYDS